MARAKGGFKTRRGRKTFLKLAKGYRGRRKNCFKVAYNAVVHALSYAYKHRREKKREMRAQWIQKINAFVRQHGLSYSKFINLLKVKGFEFNRKVLSELAVDNPKAFESIINEIKNIKAN